VRISRKRFEELVRTAAAAVMRSLPDDLKEKAGDLVFTAEEIAEPGRSEDGDDEDLLGLYEGTPLPARSIDQPFTGHDHITLFRVPLAEMCRDERELREEIRLTILHELGHFFGFDEDELEKRGLG